MNLLNLTFAETFKMPVLNPVDGSVLKMDGDQSDMFVEVYSADTQRWRAAVQEVASDASMTPEQKVCALLAKASISWNIDIDGSGKSPKFSYEQACDIYGKLPWLREQVEGATKARVNFFTGTLNG